MYPGISRDFSEHLLNFESEEFQDGQRTNMTSVWRYAAWLARCSWTVQAGLLLLSERTSKMVCWGMKRQRMAARTTSQTRVTCHYVPLPSKENTIYDKAPGMWVIDGCRGLVNWPFQNSMAKLMPAVGLCNLIAGVLKCWGAEHRRLPWQRMHRRMQCGQLTQNFNTYESLKCAWIYWRQRHRIDIGHLLLWASLSNDIF